MKDDNIELEEGIVYDPTLKEKVFNILKNYPNVLWLGYKGVESDKLGYDGAVVLMGVTDSVDETFQAVTEIEALYTSTGADAVSYYLGHPPTYPYREFYRKGADW